MNSRAAVATTAVLALAACATEIPRSRYPEVRAQLEKSVFEEGGVRMIIIQSPMTNGGRVTLRLHNPTFTESHVCWKVMDTQSTDGRFYEDTHNRSGCNSFGGIAAVGDVDYRPDLEGKKLFNDIGGPVLCIALLPLCIIGKGVPSGG